MSYNKNQNSFEQNHTMSYKKALNKITMNKAYGSTTVVDDIENYLEWRSQLITNEEYTLFSDINNTTASLQGMLRKNQAPNHQNRLK